MQNEKKKGKSSHENFNIYIQKKKKLITVQSKHAGKVDPCKSIMSANFNYMNPRQNFIFTFSSSKL